MGVAIIPQLSRSERQIPVLRQDWNDVPPECQCGGVREWDYDGSPASVDDEERDERCVMERLFLMGHLRAIQF